MPLLEEVDLAVRNELEQVADRLTAKANPPPKSVLQTQQMLARQSPQPDRLVAVRAAASPLFEAASSLLDALPMLVRSKGQLDVACADKLHRQLVSEIISFQSVCQDAELRYEHIVVASYALCTALDEFASDALRDPIDKTGPQLNAEPIASAWMAHSLAVRFHGDARGGANIFLIVGRAIIEPDKHIDLLELFFVILRLGFEGVYRHASNGRREMDRIQHRIHDLVNTNRRDGLVNLLAHWQRIESSLDASSHATPVTRPQGNTAE